MTVARGVSCLFSSSSAYISSSSFSSLMSLLSTRQLAVALATRVFLTLLVIAPSSVVKADRERQRSPSTEQRTESLVVLALALAVAVRSGEANVLVTEATSLSRELLCHLADAHRGPALIAGLLGNLLAQVTALDERPHEEGDSALTVLLALRLLLGCRLLG